MNREQAANRLTGLLCSPKRHVAALAATVCVGLSGLSGVLLAQGAAGVLGQLDKSEILSGLLSFDTQPSAMQLLATPANVELFARYFNTLAPAVTSLEQPITSYVEQFLALAQAAHASGVTLVDFQTDDENGRLLVSCTADSDTARTQFLELAQESSVLAGLAYHPAASSDTKEFTIECDLHGAISV